MGDSVISTTTKIYPFKPEDNLYSLIGESSFSTLFPKYIEKYLQNIWPLVTKVLQSHGIECRLNLVEGSMTVPTTNKTFDPYIIIKSRDFIKLLSRTVPLQHSVKVLQDEVTCNIIKINDLVQKKKRF